MGIFILTALHQPIPLTLVIGLVSALLGYGVVVLWDWFGNVRRLPAEIDSRRLSKIEELNAEVQHLKNPEKLVNLQFERIAFGQQASRQVIVLHLKILNRGLPTTLHGIRLCSTTDPKLRVRPSQNGFGEHQFGADYVRLEQGDVRSGFLEFGGTQREGDWLLEFADDKGTIHREPIPKNLYEQNS